MLHDGISRQAAIVGGVRIPFSRAHADYRNCSNQDLMTATLSALVNRYDLSGQRLGDVALGAVIKHSRDFNLARESVLGCGLAPETPSFDLQRACGTSLSGCVMIANKIALGQIDVGYRCRDRYDQRRTDRLSRRLPRDLDGQLSGAFPRSADQTVVGPAAAAFQTAVTGRGRTANEAVDGGEHRDHREGVGDHPRGTGSVGIGEPSESSGRLCRGILRGLSRAPQRTYPGQQYPRRYVAGETGKVETGL